MVRVKAQGAIEYLFMIAAALIIIFVVYRYLRGSANQTTQTVSQGAAALNSEIEQQLSSAAAGQ